MFPMSYYPNDRPPQHGAPGSLLGIGLITTFGILAVALGLPAAVAVMAVAATTAVGIRRRFDF